MSRLPPIARLRRIALALIGIVISGLALFLLGQLVDVGATIDLLRQTSPAPVAFAVVVVAAQLILRSIRWSWLLSALGPSRVRPARLVPVLLVGYLGNILLPARLGEAVRAYLVSRRELVPVSSALGTVLLERVLDLASLAVIGWVAAVLSQAPSWISAGTAVVAVFGLGVTVVLVYVGVGRFAGWVERMFGSRARATRRVAGFMVRFGAGAGGQPRRVVALAVAISGACWLLDATTFWLMGQAIGVPVAWGACLLIAAVTVLGTAIPSAPGYIGTFELAAVAAGVAIGVPSESVLAIAVLAHAVTTVPLAVGGAVSLAAFAIGPAGIRSSPAEHDGVSSAGDAGSS